MTTNDFDYYLPEELIAQTPLEKRDSSRLLVLDRKTGEIEHKHFYDIIDYLNEGDTLVLNDTKVLPARLIGVKEETNAPTQIIGATCLFMINLANNKILTCFYGVSYPFQIHARAFDPSNNFSELTDMFQYINGDISGYTTVGPYISAVSNLDKKKAFLYFIEEGLPFWLIFDYENNFSSLTKGNDAGLVGYYPKNKMYYFRETNEIVVFSSINSCKVYIIVFNNDFSVKGKNIFNPEGCYNNYLFSIYFNGEYYVLISDSSNPNDNKNFKKNLTEFEVETSNTEEPNTISIESTILKTNPIIKTQISETTIIKEDNPTIEIAETTIIKTDNPTTIPNISKTDYISQNIENYSNNKKCKTSSIESSIYDLCITCNSEEGYYPVEIEDNTLFHGFTECYNNDTKPINFYFDNSDQKYKPCYETCLTCDKSGNEINNNCLTCATNFRKKLEYLESNNCVPI